MTPVPGLDLLAPRHGELDVYIRLVTLYHSAVKRTQIYIDEDLDRRLREAAAEDGRSAAALIRDAVRAYLAERRGVPSDDPVLALAGAFTSRRPNASLEHDALLYGDDQRRG